MLMGCCHPHPLAVSLGTWHRAGARALLFLGGQRSPAALPRALRWGVWDRPPPPPPTAPAL